MSITPVKSNPPSVNSVLQSNPGDRVSSGKGNIDPVVAVLSRQLPLPQAQQLAGQTISAKVLSSKLSGEAELDVGGLNIPVKLPNGRALSPGELLTVTFALRDTEEGFASKETVNTKKIVDVRNLLSPFADGEKTENDSPSFVDKLSSSAKLISFLDKLGESKTPVPTTAVRSLNQLVQTAQNFLIASDKPANKNISQTNQINTTQLAKDISGAIAKQVSSAVENSGLFYESHLKEWANGQRSKEQLELEPQAKFGAEQVISDKGLDPSALNQSAKLVTAQLATLDQSKVALTLGGLIDKPIQVEIEPDQPNEQEQNDQESARPWVARLKLDMAQLGELEVRVRMVGSRCDVKMIANTNGKQALDPHWKDFQQAMESKGLTLVHGQIISDKGGLDE